MTILFGIIALLIFIKIVSGTVRLTRGILWWLCSPLRFFHALVTNTLPGSKNGSRQEGYIQYTSIPQLIIFGIGGNILYYGLVAFTILSILYVRDDGNDYRTKQMSYSVGDTVYILGGAQGTIEDIQYSDDGDEWNDTPYIVDGNSYSWRSLSLVKEKTDGTNWVWDSVTSGAGYASGTAGKFVSFLVAGIGELARGEVS
jgi:hypothetical protein